MQAIEPIIKKKSIRSLSAEELKDFFVASGDKAFRAKQVYEWIWKRSARSFAEMTNLSKETRTLLETNFSLNPVTIDQKQVSNDGTIKFGFRLHDGYLVEGVLIPADDRMTACISSQVGCSLTCKFCATGYMDRKRNLEAYEIYDQVVLIKEAAEEHYNLPLSNIVLMGMGEPLLNYTNVLKGIERVTAEDGLNIASKRITLSTAGIAKMITKLGDDKVKFKLALSLHAANDVKRNTIMPINESNNLAVLKESLLYFHKMTGNPITFEYIVFDGVNDTMQDAKELYTFAKNIPCKINIIEYNPIQEANYMNASIDNLGQFKKVLTDKGIIVNIRRSRGKDIDAACGQLAIKQK
ncbi:MAG: 23S rRNA (adenine(2503)-C(2))-methyltransferase RlmN [Cytophagales bacterium]|nr:23S rRNA (adenine(2503)-C(2))-methyltransferase RlmN [Cytophaga sp.]